MKRLFKKKHIIYGFNELIIILKLFNSITCAVNKNSFFS